MLDSRMSQAFVSFCPDKIIFYFTQNRQG